VHFADLDQSDRTMIEDIPVTALPRTLLDFAAASSSSALEWAIERCEERLDLGSIEALFERAGNHPGAGKLRRALALYRHEPAFTRSRLEKRFLRLVKAAGLPAPAMNFNLAGYELDACWEAERFAVELDVYETHGSPAAFERDRLREDDLMLVGVQMIRVTGPRLDREPKETIERVAEHLRRRRQEIAVLELGLSRGT
jgi:hypothetical protein